MYQIVSKTHLRTHHFRPRPKSTLGQFVLLSSLVESRHNLVITLIGLVYGFIVGSDGLYTIRLALAFVQLSLIRRWRSISYHRMLLRAPFSPLRGSRICVTEAPIALHGQSSAKTTNEWKHCAYRMIVPSIGGARRCFVLSGQGAARRPKASGRRTAGIGLMLACMLPAGNAQRIGRWRRDVGTVGRPR
jgi:hypothetical protein